MSELAARLRGNNGKRPLDLLAVSHHLAEGQVVPPIAEDSTVSG
jgi:hypothetical protein